MLFEWPEMNPRLTPSSTQPSDRLGPVETKPSGICGGPQQSPLGWHRSIHFEFTSQINPKTPTSTQDVPEQAAARGSAGSSGLLLLVVFCGASFGKFSH